jgi:hypothetical protein
LETREQKNRYKLQLKEDREADLENTEEVKIGIIKKLMMESIDLGY